MYVCFILLNVNILINIYRPYYFNEFMTFFSFSTAKIKIKKKVS